MSSRLSKIRSVHTYVMTRTVYFGWICMWFLCECNLSRGKVQMGKGVAKAQWFEFTHFQIYSTSSKSHFSTCQPRQFSRVHFLRIRKVCVCVCVCVGGGRSNVGCLTFYSHIRLNKQLFSPWVLWWPELLRGLVENFVRSIMFIIFLLERKNFKEIIKNCHFIRIFDKLSKLVLHFVSKKLNSMKILCWQNSVHFTDHDIISLFIEK